MLTHVLDCIQVTKWEPKLLQFDGYIKTASDDSLSEYVPKKGLEKANASKLSLQNHIQEVKTWVAAKAAPKRSCKAFLGAIKEQSDGWDVIINKLKDQISEAKADAAPSAVARAQDVA